MLPTFSTVRNTDAAGLVKPERAGPETAFNQMDRRRFLTASPFAWLN